MKTSKWIYLLLLTFGTSLLGKAQMNYLTIPPNIYNVTTGTATTLPGGNTNAYVNSNAAYDENGNLLFWVYQTGGGNPIEVYAANGSFVGSLNPLLYACNTPNSNISYPHREVAITPVPGECKRYFVIFWYANPQLTGQSLGFAKIDVSSGVTIAQQSQTVTCDGGNGASLAVTKELGGNRYLIARSYNWLRRYTITQSGLTNPVNLTGTLPTIGVTTDLEINPNGTRWMYADPNGSIYIVKGNISTGTVSSTVTYTVPGNPTIHSLEFNANGTSFYACTSSGLYTSSVGAGGAMTAIPGTSNYSSSDIEWGKDGFIYLTNNSGQLAKMHPTTFAITVISPTVQLYSNDYIPMTGSSIYRLPDQIDGDPYNFAPCGLTLTAAQTLLNSSCNPIIIPFGNCPNGSCMNLRYCLNFKNSGNCLVNAGTTVVLALDSRLKVCNAATTPQANLLGVFGGSGSSSCATGCCTFTANTNLGSTVFFTLASSVNPGATVQVCIDVQTATPTIDLCNNPLVSTALWTGNCSSGSFNKTQSITYKCCNWISVSNDVSIKSAMAACQPSGFIKGDQPITYTVQLARGSRGLDAATVALDENLDFSTLEIQSLTDGASVELQSPGNIVAVFPSGEGELTYSIRPLANLEEGTRILSSVVGYIKGTTVQVAVDGPKYTISSGNSLSIEDFKISYFAPGCNDVIELAPKVNGDANRLSYLWSNGETSEAITVRPNSTTAYSVKVTNDAGCESDWKSAVVVVDDMKAILNGDQYVDPNNHGTECATLEVLEMQGGSEPYTYLWSDGSTKPSIEVCPTTTSAYRVTVTDKNGCEAIEAVTVHVPGHKTNHYPVAIAEFTAVPNPFKSSSVIKFSLPMDGQVTLKVYDQMGREVATLHEGQVVANSVVSTEFTPMGLSSGIYFARLTTANGPTQTLKLVFAK